MPLNLAIVNQLSSLWTSTLIFPVISFWIGVLLGDFREYKKQKYKLRYEGYRAFSDLCIKGTIPSHFGWMNDPLFRQEFCLAKHNIDLNGSKQIKEILNKMEHKLYPATAAEMDKVIDRASIFRTIFANELKPAMQKELESWWNYMLNR